MIIRHSNLEKHREATREVIRRKNVYARCVGSAKMDPRDAQRKISIMQEIADEYLARADQERQPLIEARANAT